MIQQHNLPPQVTDVSPLTADLSKIQVWIEDWKAIRQSVEQMLDEAVGVADGHDTGPFLTLLEEIDSSIRLLTHRVGWLNNQLSHKSDS